MGWGGDGVGMGWGGVGLGVDNERIFFLKKMMHSISKARFYLGFGRIEIQKLGFA